MIFYKSVSFGNDFIHINMDEIALRNKKEFSAKDKSRLAQNICHRNTGAGSDGIVYYQVDSQSVKFEIYNRDGSEAELSGNGMAGLSALLFFLNKFKSKVLLKTKVGEKEIHLINHEGNGFNLEVEIGSPDFENRTFFPFLKANQNIYNHGNIEFYPVSVGNPHAVIVLDKKKSEHELSIIGAQIEGADIFPQNTNVEFVFPKIASETARRVFFYERGVGPTLSSSTGSAAVFAVIAKLKEAKANLTLKTQQENIRISLKRKKIYIENFTKILYKGIYLN